MLKLKKTKRVPLVTQPREKSEGLEDEVDATEENEVVVEHHEVEQLQVVIVNHPGRGSSK